MLPPLTFAPIFMERVWGGRTLGRLYAKALPEGAKVGESWEIVDRNDAVSRVSSGPLAGLSLRRLLEAHPSEIMGALSLRRNRFPWLVKLLDAREDLSIQVHPPEAIAEELGGEPKTEMWFVADAAPDACVYAGLVPGTTRASFEQQLREGTVADCIQRLPVRPGDVLFLPSGRVHALGAGLVIFEIQQNSDTTYRVFDWNRRGLDGKPRALHLQESLRSIDFADFNPQLVRPSLPEADEDAVQLLVDDPLFRVELRQLPAGGDWLPRSVNGPVILGVAQGKIEAPGADFPVTLSAGEFCLLPASAQDQIPWRAAERSRVLVVAPGRV